MQSIFKSLFELEERNRTVTAYEKIINKNIERYNLLLKENLTKRERRLLLRMIDAKNLLLEDTAIRNFENGFKLGLRLGFELEQK